MRGRLGYTLFKAFSEAKDLSMADLTQTATFALVLGIANLAL